MLLNEIEEQKAAALPEAVRARIEALERENAQLRSALGSRVVIEQAKGVLAERFRLDPTHAFELLRRAARSERRRIHDLAAEVVRSRRSPARIEAIAGEMGALDTAVTRRRGARLAVLDGTGEGGPRSGPPSGSVSGG